jgi:hypothetical protein
MGPWTELPRDISELLENAGHQILKAHILSANEMQEFVVEPFQTIMSRLKPMSLIDFAGLVELICLKVRSPDISLEYF